MKTGRTIIISVGVLVAAAAAVTAFVLLNKPAPAGTGTADPVSSVQEEKPAVKLSCRDLTDAVFENNDAFPPHMYVEDELMLTDVMGYDITAAEDYCSAVQLISADLFELTVIVPQKGREEDTEKMLTERQSYLKKQAAFYPSQVEAAEASVTGKYGGYYYLICEAGAGETEKLLKDVIDGA